MSLLKRLRFAADLTTERLGANLLTDAPAHLLKPSACQFEITLLESSTTLQSITDLDQLTLSVKLDDPRTGLALMQKTVASGALNRLLTWEDFQAGGADNCHAVFTFSAAETNLELNAIEQDFYLVIEGLDTGGNAVAFADGVITVEESGAFTAPPAAITADHFFTQEQSDARYLLAADLSAKVSRSGDTMLGPLALSGAPSDPGHAANKSYVDAQDATKQAAITGAATSIVSSNLTTSRALTSDGSGKVAVSAVTATELGYVAGVTSALQTQLNAKGPAITGGASTIATSDLTASRALVSSGSGKVAVSAATATELGYVAGLSGALQTQLDNRLPLSGGTLSGYLTLSGDPSAASHAARKAYVDAVDALKLNLSGGTLTGDVQFSTPDHAGLRLNNLSNSAISALTPTVGMLVYNTTEATVQVYEAGGWTKLGGIGGGTSAWFHDSVDPATEGSNGDYFLNDSDGSIWFKTGGSWTKIVAARLPLAGGDLTGGLGLSGGNLQIADGYHINFTGAGNVNVTTGNVAIATGDVNISDGVVVIGGHQVIGLQQAAIPDFYVGDPRNLYDVVNLILAALRTHGLIAT